MRRHDSIRRCSGRSVRRPLRRRGFALLDALIGGVMLGVGLGVLLSISSRAAAMQVDGQRRLQAAWLADEVLSMILVEGPEEYERTFPTSGRFEEPFNTFSYEIDFEENGIQMPFHIMVTISWAVNSSTTRDIVVEADIARRRNETEDNSMRRPLEPFDRQGRWDDILDPYDE